LTALQSVNNGNNHKKQTAQRNAARIRDCPRNRDWIWNIKDKSAIRNLKSELKKPGTLTVCLGN
jgi:hypothetical protein